MNLRLLIPLVVLISLTGCDTGVRQMGPTEYGVRFRKLPIMLGGGVGRKAIQPGELVIVWPWDSIYRIDTAVRGVTWGQRTRNGEHAAADYVNTRALDGNEVALGVTIRFRVRPDSEALGKMIQNAANSNEAVESIVISIARSDIRTYMSELHTSDFLQAEERYAAVNKVKESLSSKLEPYNIEIVGVVLDDFRFERLLPDNTVDSSYQDKLNDTQRVREETEREKARIDTVTAKKGQEYNEAQAKVNRDIAEAEGYKRQAILRGDAYLQSRANDAKAVLAQGRAEVQGMIEKINALSGPGGRALLKLDLARSLLKNDPKFLVMSQGKSAGIEVSKLDTNDLIKQAGIFEALQSKGEPSVRKTDKSED